MVNCVTMCSGIWRSCHCLLVVLLLLVLCFITKSTDAKVFQVGGISGWTNWDVAQGRVPDYKAWAAAQSILVGDSLEFSFAAGYHDVVLLHSSKEADREAYEMCDFALSTVLDEGFTGTYVWHATYPGEFYFACELYSPSPKLNEYVHCATGQKLAITVRPNPTAEGPTSVGPTSVGPPSVSTPPPSSPTPVESTPVIVPIAAPAETPETPLSAPSGSPEAPISSAPSGSPEAPISSAPSGSEEAPISSAPSGSPGTPSSAPSGSPQAAAPRQVTPVTPSTSPSAPESPPVSPPPPTTLYVRSPAPPLHQEQNGAGTPASIPRRWIIAAAVMLMAKIAW